jgi:hypothetical protein
MFQARKIEMSLLVAAAIAFASPAASSAETARVGAAPSQKTSADMKGNAVGSVQMMDSPTACAENLKVTEQLLMAALNSPSQANTQSALSSMALSTFCGSRGYADGNELARLLQYAQKVAANYLPFPPTGAK